MDSKSKLWTPPLTSTSTSTCSSNNSESDESPLRIPMGMGMGMGLFQCHSQRCVAVLSEHVGPVSCLALCGEFILSASQGKDIIVWQQPDLRVYAKFGQGDGSVKAVATVGNKVFTAHQDTRIRVWKLSRSSENLFKLLHTLPTTKDYFGNFIKQTNYVQTRRHHKRLWIQHADSISCLTVYNAFIYSGSWDKTLKVWRLSDFKCLESIKAHDDAINGLVACKGVLYSASADGKIKAWARKDGKGEHALKAVLEGHKDVSFNALVVSEDAKWVYGGGSDGFVMAFQTFNLLSQTKAHHMAVLCLSLMREFLCTGSADKTIGIWRREPFGKLSRISLISGHQGPVKCLQASSNRIASGFLLYTGSMDKTVRVWWVPTYNDAQVEDNNSTIDTIGTCSAQVKAD
ncbi:hypothetical protein VNO78_05024 [Psophocarpus tetragonolobus]|uniref:Uncharacterized protein n=1 Tax=Psophocarpus tetragonolobus TaxID=3891 RepID=A0AAN9SZ19_PSOTE